MFACLLPGLANTATTARKTGSAKTGAAKSAQSKSPQSKSAQSRNAASKSGARSGPARYSASRTGAAAGKSGAPQSSSRSRYARRGATPSGSTPRVSTAHQVTAPRRYGPQAPTLDRYKEIQQALADKGYYRGSVNGTWGQDSVDALKKFQQDQNLNAGGKLDALSLIALGLGPKRDVAAAAPRPVAPAGQQ